MSKKKKVKVATSMDRALGSLQDMAEERDAEKRSAALEAEAKRKREEEAAAKAEKDREEANVRARRGEELGAEQARVAAEREARARAEAAVVAERDKHAQELEAQRSATEAQLEQEEKRRKFPPWAIAGAALAAVIVLGLVGFGVYQSQKADRAEEEAKSAIRKMQELDAKRADVAKELDAATARLADARDENERKKAQDEINRIQLEKDRLDEEKKRHQAAEAEKRQKLCQKARDRVVAERKGGVHVTEADTSTALGGLPTDDESQAAKDVRRYCTP